MKSKMEHEDRSVLALLYDAHRRSYPVSVENLQREIEGVYEGIYHRTLTNPEEIVAVFVGVCDDHSRFAYEAGVRTGVQLALDLELDGMMGGGAECF
jgi:hypothetical protein